MATLTAGAFTIFHCIYSTVVQTLDLVFGFHDSKSKKFGPMKNLKNVFPGYSKKNAQPTTNKKH
jgi:hypothetical protein